MTTSPKSPAQLIKLATLDDFDDNVATVSFSPRSQEAIYSLGFEPNELLKRSVDNLPVLPGETKEFLDRRRQHYERKRQAKVEECKKRRQEIISHGGFVSSGHDSPPSPMSTRSSSGPGTPVSESTDKVSHAIAEEKRRAEKMLQRQRKELFTMVMAEVKRQQAEEASRKTVEMSEKRAQEEARRRLERQKEWEAAMKRAQEDKLEQEREHQKQIARQNAEAHADLQRQIEKQKEEERKRKKDLERQAQEREKKKAEFQADIEAKQKAHEDMVRAKQKQLEESDRQRREFLERQRKELLDQAEALREKFRQRFETNMKNQDQIREQKRQEFERRSQLAEERKRMFEEQRDKQRQQAKEKSLEKDMLIQRVREQADANLQNRIETAKAREEAVRKRLQEREEQHKQEEEERKEQEKEKQAKRQEVFHHNLQLLEQRIKTIETKRKEIDERNQLASELLSQKIQDRQMEERLLKEDREEHVRRILRIKDYRRTKLLEKISSDMQRVDDMKNQQKRLTEERMKMKHDSDIAREHLMHSFEKLFHKGVTMTELLSGPKAAELAKLGITADMIQSVLANDAKPGLPPATPPRKLLAAGSASGPLALPAGTGSGSGSGQLSHREGDASAGPAAPPPATDSTQSSAAPVPAPTSTTTTFPAISPKKKTAAAQPRALPPGEAEAMTTMHLPQTLKSSTSRPAAAAAAKKPKTRKKPAPKQNTLVAEPIAPAPAAAAAATHAPAAQPAAAAASSEPDESSVVVAPGHPVSAPGTANPAAATAASHNGTVHVLRATARHTLNPGNKASSGSNPYRRPTKEKKKKKKNRTNKGTGRAGGPRHLDRAEAQALIDKLASEQNEFLLRLLEKEQTKEAEREQIYSMVQDEAERKRLDKIFGVERAKASELIKAITKEHERVLAQRMVEYGLVSHDVEQMLASP